MNTFTYWQGPQPQIITECLDSIVRHNDVVTVCGEKDLPDEIKHLDIPVWRRVDLFRLWILSQRGGTWCDADVICLHRLPFNYHLENGFTLSGWGRGATGINAGRPYFSNAIFGCTKEVAATLYQRALQSTDPRYGATGQAILGPYAKHNAITTRRYEHWRFAYLHYLQWKRFTVCASRIHYETQCNYYNPNAYCYHLTGAVGRHMPAVKNESFAHFLLNKSKRNLFPKRSQVIVKRFGHYPTLQGTEIGVFRGKNARVILSAIPQLKLNLVDEWKRPEKPDGLTARKDWAVIWDTLQHNIGFARDRINIIRAKSKDAAAQVEDHSQDFVFIDADHADLDTDLNAWIKKVKPGGWIGGHDYNWDSVGVPVRERFAGTNSTLELDQDNTWWVKL